MHIDSIPMRVHGTTANDIAAVLRSRLRTEGEEESKTVMEKKMVDAIVDPAI